MSVTKDQPDYSRTIRPFWYDRDPTPVTRVYDAVTGPHGAIQRWIYTVPAGRKAFVESLTANVTRVTVAAPADISTAYITFAETDVAPPEVMLRSATYGNLVDDKDRMATGHSMILLEGNTIRGQTADLSTGGTCYFHVAAKITEFDA